ncbi:multiple sugar transport system permease protein [Streptomyces sp. V4I23]|uniref:carbohydrate ABC transporter permease n=1 Tax=Streptomyces sp. V4I23 TaxID=3042282 RepID=UPI00277ECB17|nr:sugar ABC transporter permease [Streptomyces sp. V4I23]MDQ1006467.1 multiple sugar transport system permease protein [Streptomyces sp. V4I23]
MTGTTAPPAAPVAGTRPPRPPATAAARRGRTARDRRLSRLGWGFASPALLAVVAVTVFPVLFSLAMSFSEVEVTGSGFRLGAPTGDNYAELFASERWRHALLFTVLYTLGTVFAEVVLGTVVALVLERLTDGRGWMMALLLLPWAMITVVSAQLWAYVYNGVYGVLSYAVEAVTGDQVNILGTPVPAVLAMSVADIWKTTPFVAIIVLAGLVMLPGDITEAARMDGANAWTIFWRVRLPLLRPTLAIAVLFRILQAFGIFDLPFVLTGGGPGDATQSLALLGWQVMFQNLSFGPGAAVAASTAALVFAGCLVFLRAFRTQVGEAEETA